MNAAIDREMVRQYLLGRLDNSETIESRVSDEIFFDEKLTDVVESVEDEIIEEYAEGLLAPADRKAVEEYFLASAERRAELRFFKILQDRFGTEATAVAPDDTVLHARHKTGRLADAPRFPWFRILIYGQAAALVGICVFGLTYFSGLQKKQTLLEADLARERVRSTALTSELERQREPIIPLTLVPGRFRDVGAKLRPVEIKSASQRIIVQIPLVGHSADPYDVVLETRESSQPLWTARLLPVITPSGDAHLVFDLDAHDLKPGVHSIVITQQGWRGYCDFEVKITN